MNEFSFISVVVPLFNEQDNVPILLFRIVHELELLGHKFEVICVDDGSSDDTFKVLEEFALKDVRIKAIKFRKNFGQTPAMAAGIDYAEGNIIITMDGDLQNDPTDFGNFLEKIDAGFDLVVGWREKRQDKLITRKIPSKIANYMIGKITGVPIKDNGCSLKAYRAEVIKKIPLYSEMHRFIPAMVSISGSSIAEISVKHHPRIHGESKYGLSRIYKVLIDLITIKMLSSFASRPLYWFFLFAIPFVLFSLIVVGLSFWIYLSGSMGTIVPIASTALLLASTAGFILLCGMLAELVNETGTIRLKELTTLVAKVVDK